MTVWADSSSLQPQRGDAEPKAIITAEFNPKTGGEGKVCPGWRGRRLVESRWRRAQAAGVTAAGAGEDDADARAAALPYARGVVPAAEDERDAPPA